MKSMGSKSPPPEHGARKQILQPASQDRAAPFGAEPATFWRILTALGAALTVVGWTDLALLWFPSNFGSPEWEFGTISAHFDGMPLGTLGLVTLCIAVLGLGKRRTARVLAAILMTIAVTLLGIFALYLLNVPVALDGVAPQLVPTIQKAVAKAIVFAATYIGLYAWLALYLWSKTRIMALPGARD